MLFVLGIYIKSLFIVSQTKNKDVYNWPKNLISYIMNAIFKIFSENSFVKNGVRFDAGD